MRLLLPCLLGAAAAAVLPPGGAPASAQSLGPASQGRPSIVLILTDDEDLASHAAMPKTKALLEERGTTFTDYFVTYSFCSPSRATILRGQYPHNHNVEGNQPPAGGFEKFRALGHEASTVATWLDRAGYRTALVGKYLNGYRPELHGPVAGWDHWYVTGAAYYGYEVNEDGKRSRRLDRPEDYLTDVLAAKAVEAIERAAAAGEPLFLHLAPYAPHSPSTPAPRHAALFADAALPRPVSFDEPDVRDKPSAIRDLPALSQALEDRLEARHRDRLRSLQAVDDLVGSVVDALRRTGRLERTYLVYTSDNGFHLGQHRLGGGKTTAYEEDIRVPLVVRGPGVPQGRRVAAMVLNNDLAPTLAAMAGVEPPAFVDGRSFLPLLADPRLGWRRSFLVERRETERRELRGAAVFDALRVPDLVYVEHGTGERELYDLRRDPLQLYNRAGATPPPLLAALSLRLAELKNCAAATCRELEDRPLGPIPAGGPK
jgi:arylsulfatase A-like enzyme